MNAFESRVSERGIAMIATMFMVLLLTVLGSSMMFLSQTESLSSLNYKTMSQARYAAESGVHAAAKHLLYDYDPPTSTSTDDLAFYDMTTSPVQYDGEGVVLSSNSAESHYPVQDVKDAFSADSQGSLSAGVGTVSYTASATLLSMRTITDDITGESVTLQTWEITGRGTVGGVASAQVEVSAIIERQERPIYPYAAFAQDDGCEALKFGGGATTNSYDSRLYSGTGSPALDEYGGNVGTNGNLTELGSSTVIHGSLSTPRSGVGSCSNGGVTALSLSGDPTLDDGVIQLPQAITWPTPAEPSPAPSTDDYDFSKNGGCPGGLTAPQCTAITDGARLDAAGGTITLGDVSATSGAQLRLTAGTYVVNSFTLVGNSELIIESGPVYLKVANNPDVATPVDLTGGTLSNTTYDPKNLRIVYGGEGTVKMAGGTGAAALLYAPEASMSFTGQSDFYGAVIAKKITDMGGVEIHYDRALNTSGFTTGNPTMSAFSWKSF